MKFAENGMILAFGSMFFMGISSFLYKRSTDAIGPTNTTFFYYLFSIFIATGVWLVFRERQDFDKTALVWPLIIAVCLFLSVWLFNMALTEVQVSVAATIRGLFFLVTSALAFLVLKETPSTIGIYAIGFAAISLILLGVDAALK